MILETGIFVATCACAYLLGVRHGVKVERSRASADYLPGGVWEEEKEDYDANRHGFRLWFRNQAVAFVSHSGVRWKVQVMGQEVGAADEIWSAWLMAERKAAAAVRRVARTTQPVELLHPERDTHSEGTASGAPVAIPGGDR